MGGKGGSCLNWVSGSRPQERLVGIGRGRYQGPVCLGRRFSSNSTFGGNVRWNFLVGAKRVLCAWVTNKTGVDGHPIFVGRVRGPIPLSFLHYGNWWPRTPTGTGASTGRTENGKVTEKWVSFTGPIFSGGTVSCFEGRQSNREALVRAGNKTGGKRTEGALWPKTAVSKGVLCRDRGPVAVCLGRLGEGLGTRDSQQLGFISGGDCRGIAGAGCGGTNTTFSNLVMGLGRALGPWWGVKFAN